MALQLNLLAGHKSNKKAKPNEFTHDWELYIDGCGDFSIDPIVSRVVVKLHETFQKPTRGMSTIEFEISFVSISYRFFFQL